MPEQTQTTETQQTQQTQQTQTPWYQGKADAETLGHWQNKGWKVDDPAAIAIEATKAARELQKHFGVPAERIIKLPAAADDAAGWKEVHSRLGVPAEPKDYDFASVKRADGTALDDALAGALRNALHGAGVAKDAAPNVVKAVVKHLDDDASAKTAIAAAKLGQERAELERSWGQNKDFNLLTAMQGARRLGISDAEVEALKTTVGGLKVMEMFRRVGAATSEDTFTEGKQGGMVTTHSGAEARKAELMGDPDFRTRYLAGGAKERQEMAALNTIIAGAIAA